MIVSVIGARAYPSNFVGNSGLEVYLHKILNHLKMRSDVDFIIYTKSVYQNRLKEVKHPKITVKPLITFQSKVLETFFYSLFAACASCLDQSTIVWFHGVGSSFFAFLPKLFGKKIFITIHSLDWQRKKWTALEQFIFSFLATIVLKNKALYFTVSLSLQRQLKQKYNLDTIYAPPGINFVNKKIDSLIFQKKFLLRTNEYLLYLGRIVPEKRIEWLIDTFQSVKKQYPKLILAIAGRHGNFPDYEKALKKRYKSAGVKWLGHVLDKEKIILLQNCRCFILPSELEGNPISLFEALSVNSFCLTSDKVAKELPKLKNLLDFKINSKDSFKSRLQSILSISTKNYKYNRIEMESLKKFNWKNTAERYFR